MNKPIKRRKKARKSKNRKTTPIVIGLIVLLLGGWLGWNFWRGANTTAVASSGVVGTNVGDSAPDFSVPTLAGSTFSLADQRGKPTILFFMAYWCGTCIPEARALAQIHQKYGEQISVVAIDVDPSSTPEALTQFKRAAGDGDFTWAFDAGQQVAQRYQVRSLDTTLVLNGNGVVVYRDEYPTPYSTLEKALAKAGLN